MKKKILLLAPCLLLIAVQLLAQEGPEKLEILGKVDKYRKMENVGRTTTVLSSIAGGIGAIIMIESFWEHGRPSPSFPYTLGEAMVVAGTIGTITGITFWIKGSKNKHKYEKKLEGLSVRVKMDRQLAGLTLSYRF